MAQRYHTWCIRFKDLDEQSTNWVDLDGITHVEGQLMAVFHSLNVDNGANNGTIDT